MIDREKVALGLECCVKSWRDCQRCPYKPPRCGELLRDFREFMEEVEAEEDKHGKAD